MRRPYSVIKGRVIVRIGRFQLGGRARLGVRPIMALLLAALMVAAAPGIESALAANQKLACSAAGAAGSDRAAALAVQGDGKIVLAGRSLVPSGRGAVALARYLPNGALDPAFGNGGRVVSDFGGRNAEARALQLLGSGKLLVAGFQHSGQDEDFLLVRYRADGAVDQGFGDHGRVLTDFGGFERAVALAVQSDGKIVLAGTTRSGGIQHFALARYRDNGTLDGDFGQGGLVTSAFGDDDEATAVAILPNGRIVVGGRTANGLTLDDFALAGFLANGQPDPDFGADGQVVTDVAANFDQVRALAALPDGRLLAAGSSNQNGTQSFALVGSSRVDLQACKLEYSIVSPK